MTGIQSHHSLSRLFPVPEDFEDLDVMVKVWSMIPIMMNLKGITAKMIANPHNATITVFACCLRNND